MFFSDFGHVHREFTCHGNHNIYGYPKIGEERGNSYQKNEEISRWKAHLNTWKLNWNVSMITYVFLDEKRVNVCKCTVKMASRGVIFTICSNTFILFWLRKISVIINMFQLSFHVFICGFHLEISSFFAGWKLQKDKCLMKSSMSPKHINNFNG